MRIANIAALILVTASFPAFAQRSGGHVERKPSPATSAVSPHPHRLSFRLLRTCNQLSTRIARIQGLLRQPSRSQLPLGLLLQRPSCGLHPLSRHSLSHLNQHPPPLHRFRLLFHSQL